MPGSSGAPWSPWPSPGPLPSTASPLDGLSRQDPVWRSRLHDLVAVGDLQEAEGLLAELDDAGLARAVRSALQAYNLEDILQQLR